jgi:hypothetical protein
LYLHFPTFLAIKILLRCPDLVFDH